MMAVSGHIYYRQWKLKGVAGIKKESGDVKEICIVQNVMNQWGQERKEEGKLYEWRIPVFLCLGAWDKKVTIIGGGRGAERTWEEYLWCWWCQISPRLLGICSKHYYVSILAHLHLVYNVLDPIVMKYGRIWTQMNTFLLLDLTAVFTQSLYAQVNTYTAFWESF